MQKASLLFHIAVWCISQTIRKSTRVRVHSLTEKKFHKECVFFMLKLFFCIYRVTQLNVDTSHITKVYTITRIDSGSASFVIIYFRSFMPGMESDSSILTGNVMSFNI